jgi:hypothetical protein
MQVVQQSTSLKVSPLYHWYIRNNTSCFVVPHVTLLVIPIFSWDLFAEMVTHMETPEMRKRLPNIFILSRLDAFLGQLINSPTHLKPYFQEKPNRY